MGIVKSGLSNVLFSKVSQKILALLYCRSDCSFYTNEIIRISKSGTGAVQRELESLNASGLITVKKIGNQKHYQANIYSPIYLELRSIILKTFGLADILRQELEPAIAKIQIAFIYGSVAKQEDTVNSDIDLMLIGEDLTYADVFILLEKANIQLGRTINPNFYSPLEWVKRIMSHNNFVSQIIKQPKIFIIGDDNELNKLR